jgi:hypothetical protein
MKTAPASMLYPDSVLLFQEVITSCFCSPGTFVQGHCIQILLAVPHIVQLRQKKGLRLHSGDTRQLLRDCA